MEHNIEVVRGKKYKAVESPNPDSCDGCAFEGARCFNSEYPDCDAKDRKDNKDVIYKQVKEETK